MLYGTMIYILYIMGGKNVAIIHIYGARGIFILFYDDQDTASD